MENLTILLDGIVDYETAFGGPVYLILKNMKVYARFNGDNGFLISYDNLNADIICSSAGEAFEDIKRLLTLK